MTGWHFIIERFVGRFFDLMHAVMLGVKVAWLDSWLSMNASRKLRQLSGCRAFPDQVQSSPAPSRSMVSGFPMPTKEMEPDKENRLHCGG